MLPRLHSLTLTGCEVRTDLLRELKRQRPKISTYLHELY
jgi:cell division FtsZ-interacting protein ZapD